MGGTHARRRGERSGFFPGEFALPLRDFVGFVGAPTSSEDALVYRERSERVLTLHRRVSRHIARVPVPAGRFPGGVAPQPRTTEPRQVRAVRSRIIS